MPCDWATTCNTKRHCPIVSCVMHSIMKVVKLPEPAGVMYDMGLLMRDDACDQLSFCIQEVLSKALPDECRMSP